MEGLYFLLSIVATGLVMWWVIQNDNVGIGGKTSGLFAMRDDVEPTLSKRFFLPKHRQMPRDIKHTPPLPSGGDKQMKNKETGSDRSSIFRH